MLLSLRVPAGNTRGPQYLEQALAAIHQANADNVPFFLLLGPLDGGVTLACRFSEKLRGTIAGQLYAQFPDCRLDVLDQQLLTPDHADAVWYAELTLVPDLFPIRRYAQFDDPLNHQNADPLTSLIAALADPGPGLRAVVEIAAVPARDHRRSQARWALDVLPRVRPAFLSRWFVEHATSPHILHRIVLSFIARISARRNASPPAAPTSRNHDREDDFQAGVDKAGRHLFETRIRLCVSGPPDKAGKAAELLRTLAGSFGQFANRQAAFRLSPVRQGDAGRWGGKPGFLLSAEELATLWHPPTAAVQAPTLHAVASRELPPPMTLPSPSHRQDAALLGLTSFRGKRQRCGILPDDRLRHVLIEGKTGMGKTTLLHHLLHSDILAGRGAALIDPHGDLCDAVLAGVPTRRTNDVVLFEAGDTSFPLAFNVLHCPRPEQRPLVASGVLSALKKLYGEFWGPRMEHILRNALLALLEVPDGSLLGLLRLLTDAKYRADIVGRVSDPVVRGFWRREFASLPAKLQAETLSPVLNKIGAFISSPILRHIVGQGRSALSLRSIMDDGKILLVNLSKGRIGDDASALLGSFLVTALQLAAISRADVPESQRPPFFLYIDEFQNFATDSFAVILSEARKFRLALTLANQYLDQMDETVRSAVFGNAGTIISFQVGPADAEVLAQQLGEEVTPGDLLRLPRHQAYVRLLVDGMPSRPFSLLTLPPPGAAGGTGRADVIRRVSRKRYARPVSTVEREIAVAFGA